MVATVRNLTSSSSTAAYFRNDGGYYVAVGGDREDARAKEAEHRRGSAWHGRGAAVLGLAGKTVSAGAFERLLQGHVPGTDIRLGRLRHGQHEHRPGFDITFSAPKSVSLAALLPTEAHPRGDRGVLRCHDEAVKATLDWIEETLVETRGWDPETRRRPRVKGDGMAAALFRHVASRNLDPQLHTHAVVANMTRDGEGRWKSIEPTLLHRNARLIGAYYRNELSRRLIERGYSIVPAMAGRLRSFEIAGYDRALREAFSTRRRQILAFLDEKGWDGSAAAAQMAALATRRRKAEPLHGMLRTIWADRARGLGAVPLSYRRRGAARLPEAPSALGIVWHAMRHLEERRSVFAAADLEELALGHAPGRHSIGAVRAAIDTLVRDAHLVEATLKRADRAYVTDRALKAERAVIAAMKAGKGRGAPLAREEDVAAYLADRGLTEGQEEAVRTLLLSEDRIVGVQGRAGTGKTAMLSHMRALAGGRFVLGLAPSAAAARVLARETDMPARTLQWFLTRCRAVEDPGSGPGQAPGSESPGSSPGQAGAGGQPGVARLKEMLAGAVLVLDEASMVSTDRMKSLMRVADGLGVARLALVGDRSQLRAVEAGQPFRQLQQAGMTTAVMDEILRQRNPALRAAVEAVLEGEPGEAVGLLGSSVHEAAWDELGRKAAEAWLALDPETRARTLLVAPTHEMRAEVNGTVREALAAEGVLRGKALRIDRLVGLGMTRTEKGEARNYREGDVVVFHQDLVNYRVKRDDALTVTGVEEGRVLLMHPDGRPRRVAPDRGYIRYRLEVYETQPIEIMAGDRIRWTRNDRARELANGERAAVEAITPTRVRFLLDDGRKLSLRHDDPQLRHIDHAWSTTAHGAQGSTADHVIAVLDSGHGALTDQATFYVEISRARDSAVVLTDNREELVEALEAHTGERATALEAVGEEIGPDAVRIPGKLPAWTPREEWTRLEDTARNEGTILFRVEGYDDLVDRTRRLAAHHPALPAPIREVVDGLLAYDRLCREGDGGAAEFLRLLETHAGAREVLEGEAEAGDRPVAALDGYSAWRAMSERLAANGRALTDDTGARAGEAGPQIEAHLERLETVAALDEAVLRFEALYGEAGDGAEAAGAVPLHAEGELLELARALAPQEFAPQHLREAVAQVLAGAEAFETRRAEIAALREETAGLVEEHGRLEASAGAEPPTVLAAWRAWAGRVEAATGRWQALQDDPALRGPHTDRLEEEAAEITVALDRLGELRARDEAWAALAAARLRIRSLALGRPPSLRPRPPFYLGEWPGFAAQAAAFAERADLPAAAATLAGRILDYDRDCREARAAIRDLLADVEEHGRQWESLEQRAARRREAEDPDVSMADLPEYGPLSGRAAGLREAGRAILEDGKRYDPHLDRMPRSRRGVEGGMKLLERHGPLDRFARVRDRLAETRAASEARGVLAFHDAGYGAAIGEAEELEQEPALEAAARRRLQAALDEHADRAAEWARVAGLLADIRALDRRSRGLERDARRDGVPVSLLPGASGWREDNRVFAEEARAALDDSELHERGHWRSRPETRAAVGEAEARALERSRAPEEDYRRIREMTRAEMVRLADPDVKCAFRSRWWNERPLAVGDRLRFRRRAGGPENEAVVVRSGWSGGLHPKDSLTLRWLGSPPGHEVAGKEETILLEDLSGRGVLVADWSDERLRGMEVDRQRAQAADGFPLDARRDLVTGDILRWAELIRGGRFGMEERQGDILPEVVQFEGRLLARAAAETVIEDRCRVEVSWRSDGGPPGARSLALGRLTGRGCWRALAGDEEARRDRARVEARQLVRQRKRLLELKQELKRTRYETIRP